MTAIKTFLYAGALFVLLFANASSAQTISIAQGQGQLNCDGCATGTYSFFDDVVVLVTDSNGNPLSNVPVNWTVTDADQISAPHSTLVNGSSTLTGSSTAAGAAICAQAGYSCNRYPGSDTGGITLRVMAVTASLNNGKSVTFTLTESPAPSPNGITEQNANATVTAPQYRTLFQGTAGTTSSTPITATVFTNGGLPIPHVSVRLIPDSGTPAGSPTVSCAAQTGADPGSVLTNSQGVATCNVVFGPTPSTGNSPLPVYFHVLIGGVVNPQFPQNIPSGGGPAGFAQPGDADYQLIVTPATPNAVNIISGNTQSAAPGAAITNPLVVEVVDSSSPAIPLQSIPVTWTVSPAGAASVSSTNTTTGSNGETSVTVTLASTAVGAVHVTATASNGKSTTFNLTAVVVVTVTSIAIESGNNQSAPVGTAFQPLTVLVSPGTGQSASGISVTWAVASGSATLTAATSNTSATGIAGIGVNAGTTAGPVTVTATAGGRAVTFQLTVTPPGLQITSASFLNGAGFFPTGDQNSGALSPCSIGTLVIGLPLTAATLPVAPNLYGAFIQQPMGVAITFNPGTTPDAAPILNITGANTAQALITFQVPCDIVPSSAVPVSVTYNGASTNAPVSLDIRAASPGIFELPMSDGVRRAVAVRPDGTLVSLDNPARRGEIVRLYVTGIGPTLPAIITGSLPPAGVTSMYTANFVAVEVGSGDVPVLTSSQVSPSLIGVFEIDVEIPATLQSNNNTFLEVGVLIGSDPTKYQFAQPGVGSKLPIQ